MSKSIYDEAEEAGRKAGDSERKRLKSAFRSDSWMSAFLCWYASQHPGLEAAYRRFAVGFDPANKRWAEGDDG